MEISLEDLVKRFPGISKPDVPVVQIDSDSSRTESNFSDCQIVSEDTDSSETSKRREGNNESVNPELSEYFEEVEDRKAVGYEKTLTDEAVMAALVAEHMTKVAPELAAEFKKEFRSVKIQLTLSDVVNHFHRTSKPEGKAFQVLKKDQPRNIAKSTRAKTKFKIPKNNY